jgi:Response regulators consisting of a CheY-like receiver domain and a winged-helix DNA-binding domain
MKNTKQQHNILIVDDTPENLRLLATALQREGYVVRVAPTGDLAINMANTETPDLIILDIDMPDMNGYEVCEALKENRSLSVVPVIFLSCSTRYTVKGDGV